MSRMVYRLEAKKWYRTIERVSPSMQDICFMWKHYQKLGFACRMWGELEVSP